MKDEINKVVIDDNFDLDSTIPSTSQTLAVMNNLQITNTQSQPNGTQPNNQAQSSNTIDLKLVEKYKKQIKNNLRCIARAKNHVTWKRT